MKLKLAFVLFAVLVSMPVWLEASPILVSDSAAEDIVDSCQIAGDGFNLPCVLDASKAIRIDLATLAKGRDYTITTKFCTQGGLWCSDPSVPFTFTAPSLGSPVMIRLSTQ